MTPYLQWLIWATANVYAGAAVAWWGYRSGYKSGLTQAERERVVNALGGAGAPTFVRTKPGLCPFCGSSKMSKGSHRSETCVFTVAHQHCICAACKTEYIVKPQ